MSSHSKLLVAAALRFANERFDVRPGEWVTFLSPDGHLIMALSFGSAAETLGCSKEEPIILHPVE